LEAAASRILIAEDEPRLSSLLEKGLRAAGYSTTVCDDGVIAATMSRDAEFDLLILDLGLPGQDGFAALRAIRGRGEKLTVLILTARDGVAATIAGLDGGVDDYVTKPFVFDELLGRVRARLRAPGSGLELRGGRVRLDLRTRRAAIDGDEVGYLRRKLGPERFETVPGMGYRLKP
jgi:DNA-binding response OmpR family regulator